ncbi:MAG: helix-hairpin-helix domain-containing protein [Acidobacteriaceae bacterium]
MHKRLSLTFAFLALATLASAQPAQRPSQHPASPTPTQQLQPSGEPLDINTATPAQLNALPGFGPVYTQRVIAGRPYHSKNQLFTRGVIPEGTYEAIASLIVAHHHPR